MASKSLAYRGRLIGLLLMLLGGWGALVPFVGPYFGYAYTPDKAWVYTPRAGCGCRSCPALPCSSGAAGPGVGRRGPRRARSSRPSAESGIVVGQP